jgi:hypothetical protein
MLQNLFEISSSLMYDLEERRPIVLQFFNTVFYVAERSVTPNFGRDLGKHSWTPSAENKHT